MRHVNDRFLWVDAHCICQDTCGAGDCVPHSSCVEQKATLQAMDLAYQLSEHPVALLGRPITSDEEMSLLADVLKFRFVQGGDIINLERALKALALLYRITSDLWWTRAWTFQENYRAGKNMTLLIPHKPSLERRKISYRIFGDVPRELCVRSVRFCEAASELCRAAKRYVLEPKLRRRVQHVLTVAGKYTLLVSFSRSMSPSIIWDIHARDIGQIWDRLAIIANCCQYSRRLDIESVQGKNQSLSLSVLAMYLLNGEIFHNNSRWTSTPLTRGMTVAQYIDAFAFDGFFAPEGQHRLTFNKGCRFLDVKLNWTGVVTSGHLWRLRRTIHTRDFPSFLPWIERPNDFLTLEQQKNLVLLSVELHAMGENTLACQLDEYLAQSDVRPEGLFPQRYMDKMAGEVAMAIKDGKPLRLGQIWDPYNPRTPCTAIFISRTNVSTHTHSKGGSKQPCNSEGTPQQDVHGGFVFTASRPRVFRVDVHDMNDLDHHVSLEVECQLPGRTSKRLPRLYTKRWILGLCFFKGWPRMHVIFPWPIELLDRDLRA